MALARTLSVLITVFAFFTILTLLVWLSYTPLSALAKAMNLNVDLYVGQMLSVPFALSVGATLYVNSLLTKRLSRLWRPAPVFDTAGRQQDAFALALYVGVFFEICARLMGMFYGLFYSLGQIAETVAEDFKINVGNDTLDFHLHLLSIVARPAAMAGICVICPIVGAWINGSVATKNHTMVGIAGVSVFLVLDTVLQVLLSHAIHSQYFAIDYKVIAEVFPLMIVFYLIVALLMILLMGAGYNLYKFGRKLWHPE